MNQYFRKVKTYLLDLEYTILSENEEESLFVVEKPEWGITNLIIDCEDTLLIIEQHLFDISSDNVSVFKSLLQKNREIIHGAFVLDETGKRIIFRDTLQLKNLDLNELEASINSLAILLSEYSNEIIRFSKL